MAFAGDGNGAVESHHQTSAYALGARWILCVVFWITKLIKLRIIQIHRLEPAEQGPSQTAIGPGSV
jgi:hypothetical protein